MTVHSPNHVIFVPNGEVWREIYERESELAGIDIPEFFEDPDKAIERIQDLEYLVKAVFTDGLNGRWSDIVTAAKNAGAPTFVISGERRIKETVEAEGATFIAKPPKDLGFIGNALSAIQTE